MSILSAQCDELRDKAKLLRGHADGLKAPYVIPSTKELMMLTMLDSATRMEEAADTIEELSAKLQGVMGTRYNKLFSTPERAAETLEEIKCDNDLCEFCPMFEACDNCLDVPLLEWLRGDA